MRKTKVKITPNKIAESALVLRALAHPLRMRILAFIDKHEKINVNKIYNTLKLEQSITSQHLKILRLAGIVENKREGKFIFYNVNYKKLKNVINKGMKDYLEKDEERAKQIAA